MNSNVAAAENKITIDYALTRGEVAGSYLRAIRESPEYLRSVITMAAVIGLGQMALRALFFRRLGGPEILSAFIVFAAILVLLPIGLFLTAKTDRRTLAISPAGISTVIGKRSGQIPWSSVKVVRNASTFVLIARTNGNAFFIPDRAFARPGDRARFLEHMDLWRSNKTNT